MTGITRTAEALRDLVTRVMQGFRWTLSSVEIDETSYQPPMPGPAHGPVPAIELRLRSRTDASRRRAA